MGERGVLPWLARARRDCRAEQRFSILWPVKVIQHAAEALFQRQGIGLDAQAFAQRLLRIFKLPKNLLREPQSDVGIDVVGLQANGFFERRQGFRKPRLRAQQIAQIVVHLRELWIGCDGTPIEGLRLGQAHLCASQQGHQVQRVGIFRLLREDDVQRGFCCKKFVSNSAGRAPAAGARRFAHRTVSLVRLLRSCRAYMANRPGRRKRLADSPQNLLLEPGNPQLMLGR